MVDRNQLSTAGAGEPSTDTDRHADTRQAIADGRVVLGVELGSTRIKAVLVGPDNRPVASGSHDWENQYVDGVWTYALDDVWRGIQDCYAALGRQVQERYGIGLGRLEALGVSAMMHGYLPLDADGDLLTPFRTWRNTDTGDAASRLTELLNHNVPHRWSVAHLVQAAINREQHLSRLARLTTLAGYVHWRLSGQHVLGVGDASGMFPIDESTSTYNADMLRSVEQLLAGEQCPVTLVDLLPDVRLAGQPAGALTPAGAALLDPTGALQPGTPMCPPEGDAGTGMVATNTVAPRTANVSAGTSIFAMVVLERALSEIHPEIDSVTTPSGSPVAMVHCNNGASELNAWVALFAEFAALVDAPVDTAAIFETLYTASLCGAADCGGLTAYNYLSGEPITGLPEGRPLFFRTPSSRLSLANFVRAQLFASLATLRLGLDVLTQAEGVQIDRLFAHGGFFKTEGVGQRYLAAAAGIAVDVGDIAAEGGAWGIAVLAAFLTRRRDDASLQSFLDTQVFAGASLRSMSPDPADVTGFGEFLSRFTDGLAVERAAVGHTGPGERTHT